MSRIKTLCESGYKGRPYIHDSKDVCFVWFEKTPTGRQGKGLSWVSFSRTRSTGKLGKDKSGFLVPVHVPSAHYTRSVDELAEIACATTLYSLRKGNSWVGPFLYHEPSSTPAFGDNGTFLLAKEAPAHSAGVPLSYQVAPDLSVSLAAG